MVIDPLPNTPTTASNTPTKKRKRYTVEEEDIIRENWNKVSRQEIADMLPGRSVEDVRGKARHLGLSK